MLKCLWWRKRNSNLTDTVDYNMFDQQWIFCVFSHTLLVDVLWRQSILQIKGRGRKSNAYGLHV